MDDDESAAGHRFNGRATLRWTPTEQWDISFIADMLDSDDKTGFMRYAVGPNTTDRFEVSHDEETEKRIEENNSQILKINYKSESFKVTSLTGVTYGSYAKSNDSDMYSNPKKRIYNEYSYDARQYSQEIRVNSLNEGNFQWLAGLFGFLEENSRDHKNTNKTKGKLVHNHVFDMEAQGFAAFGQATYTMLDRLHVMAGLRFDYQDMQGDYVNKATGLELQQDLECRELLPKFSLSYDVADGVMAYATVAKGYLVGGYNWRRDPEENTFDYEPEYSWNYEAGLKSTWLNNRLMANLSLFYITVDDKQVSIVDPDTTLYTIENAAKAYSYGLEVELKARPVSGLELFANFGFNQCKFDEFISTGWNSSYTEVVTQDMAGNYLPYAPPYTFSAGIQYRAECGFMARADVFGTGKFYADAANTVEQEGYELVNLKIGYEGKNWDIYFWVKNLFDQEYFVMMGAQSGGSNFYATDGGPRTFGVTVAYRF